MKIEQQQQARNLFFETNLNQLQIAELIGISQKTLSLWACDGQWKQLKKIARQTPMIVVDQMYSEVTEINEAISARQTGKRYATPEEAETRRKTLASIAYIREYQIPQSHAEVMYNFMDFVRRLSATDAQFVVKYADRYLKGEVRLGQDRFDTYPLHATPDVPDTLPKPYENDATQNDPRWNEVVKKFREQSGNADQTNEAA